MQAFSKETFSLLAAMDDDGSYDNYSRHKTELAAYVEEPFKRIFNRVAELLPDSIKQVMEIEKNLYGRIWLGGGACGHYWAAFYPKGSHRQEDAQLLLFIKRHLLEFGFYIGHEGAEAFQLLIENCQDYQNELLELLGNDLSRSGLVYGTRGQVAWDGSLKLSDCPLSDFLRDPSEMRHGQQDGSAMVVLHSQDVLAIPTEELSRAIAQTFIRVFPFVLLSISDDPMPLIEKFKDEVSNLTLADSDNPVFRIVNAYRSEMPPSVQWKPTRKPLPSIGDLVTEKEAAEKSEPEAVGDPSKEWHFPSELDELTDSFDPETVQDQREWVADVIVRRRGQPQFRQSLLTAYDNRCAVTGYNLPATLEAAHITGYFGPQSNHSANGILLRSDIHTLFDLYLLAIDSSTMTVLLAPALLHTTYKYLAGKKLTLPEDNRLWPSKKALDWHRRQTKL